MSQRDKILLAGLGIFLALFGSYFLIVRPKLSQFAQAKEKYEEELDAYETDKNYLKRLKELEKNFELTEVEIIKAKKALPDNFEMASLIVEIANIFQDSGIDIESIKPAEPAEDGKLLVQNIEVVVTHKSSMYRLLSALRRIESSGRYFKVTGIDSTVQEGESTEEDSALKTNIKLNVYSLPESKAGNVSDKDKSKEKNNGT